MSKRSFSTSNFICFPTQQGERNNRHQYIHYFSTNPQEQENNEHTNSPMHLQTFSAPTSGNLSAYVVVVVELEAFLANVCQNNKENNSKKRVKFRNDIIILLPYLSHSFSPPNHDPQQQPQHVLRPFHIHIPSYQN